MRSKLLKNLAISLISGLLFAHPAMAGLTVGGGPIPGIPFGTPKAAAEKAYSRGTKTVDKAVKLEIKAANTTDAAKREKLLAKAGKKYDKAIEQFQEAISQKHDYQQAYGGLGNVYHRRGDYPAAIRAYNKALTIDPEYGPALRDRGIAFLDAMRIPDAKTAYLESYKLKDPLFANDLMDYMNAWIEQRRQEPGDLQSRDIESFASWVLTRSLIAQQASTN